MNGVLTDNDVGDLAERLKSFIQKGFRNLRLLEGHKVHIHLVPQGIVLFRCARIGIVDTTKTHKNTDQEPSVRPMLQSIDLHDRTTHELLTMQGADGLFSRCSGLVMHKPIHQTSSEVVALDDRILDGAKNFKSFTQVCFRAEKR